MTKPATITSPSHAGGVAGIITAGALAVQLLVGVAQPKALGDLLGFYAASTLVPLLMFTAASGALLCVLAIPRLPDPAGVMLVEIACKVVLGVTTLAYGAALTVVYGWSGGASTQTLAWGLGLGFTVRAFQIIRDLRALTRSQEAAVPATPPPLGETDVREG